ncbi:polysaccharide biosynthesis/export family protein [uncultured Thiocystis sp.]|jgi:protein involved in polysaccharide export with SLBB domain|uniref:polysaccharide biosynthesis/export family protein n=1 Tax=uncultured Thiocystis sp. TaxID=1202134 RepID=UPI0025F4776A|nr:polysaccharide biosynthesis/export family protein [uncultured Thiocystis sp.]
MNSHILPWLLCTLLTGAILSPLVAAQGINARVDVPADQAVKATLDNLENPPSMSPRPGTYGPINLGSSLIASIKPFGANLFEGGFRGVRAAGLNPSYRVMPGDQVTVRAWGALEMDRALPVDAQGNIFIPQVGPVQVQGISSSELNARVTAAIGDVFTDNVSVYTNLQGVQPVAVFVTGYVNTPGRYAGTPSDSVLNFLDQAGGINLEAGSFRDIRVLRKGRSIAQVDLYPFLLSGILPQPQFEEGDTIVVGQRGAMVNVSGDVAQAHRYELSGITQSVDDVLQWVLLKPGVTRALLSGVRDTGPFSQYITMSDLRQQRLTDGDELLFAADQRYDTILVELEGSFEGPSRFTIPRDARLNELLDSVQVNPELADVESVSIRRRGVAQRQRDSLEDSLRRLETAYLGASSQTVEEAKIRVSEATLIQDFVKRARQLQPTGRLVVAEAGVVRNIGLQDGDIITIPARSDSIFVSGEVLVPQAMVYRRGQTVEDYIDRAGGFTDRANTSMILLARQSGEVVAASGTRMRPGDEILVLPKIPFKSLELAKTLTDILFNLAVTTRTVLYIGAYTALQ